MKLKQMKVDRTTAGAVGTIALQNSEGMNTCRTIIFKFHITVKVTVRSCSSLQKSALFFTWLVFQYLHVC